MGSNLHIWVNTKFEIEHEAFNGGQQPCHVLMNMYFEFRRYTLLSLP